MHKLKPYNSYFYFLTLLTLWGCGTTVGKHKRLMTEHLYLQPGRISITHPNLPATQRSSAQNTMLLSEQVNYTQTGGDVDEAEVESDQVRLDTSQVYKLSEVVVTSKARFSPVRQGNVTIDFLIHIPREFLSEDCQISITPELLHNDSVVRFDDVVLRGKNFIAQQEKDYERYEAYLGTIVDPTGYDTVFIDRNAINRELNRRRKNELNQYSLRWEKFQEYNRWRVNEQTRYDEYNIRQESKLRQQLHKHEKEYKVALFRALAMRKDTTSLNARYRQKRREIMASAPVRKQITLGTVPAAYREFYLNGTTAFEFNPVLPAESDSMQIAAGFVLHERIAANEIKGHRLEETFRHMVPSPYRPDAHYNGVIVPEHILPTVIRVRIR